MAHVQRVAASGEVGIQTQIGRLEAVVAEVVDATEAQGRSKVAAFGGMVVDHVEYHFDTRPMHRLDHRLELGHLLAEHTA